MAELRWEIVDKSKGATETPAAAKGAKKPKGDDRKARLSLVKTG
jgi:hypothetical protein